MKSIFTALFCWIAFLPATAQEEWWGIFHGNEYYYFDESGACFGGHPYQDIDYNADPNLEDYCTSVSSSGLPDLRTTAVAVGSEGQVLIGTQSGFAIRYPNQTWQTYNTKTSALETPSPIQGLFMDSQGVVWVSNQVDGMFKLEDENWTVYPSFPGSSFAPAAFDFEEDFLTDIWAAGSFGFGHYDRDLEDWTFYNTSTNAALPSGPYVDMAFDGDYSIWGAHQFSGLVYFNPGLAQVIQYNTSNSGIVSNFLTAVYFADNPFSENDTIWYATADQGIGYLLTQEETFTHFSANDYPEWTSNQINDLIRAGETGDFYLSSPVGVFQFDGSDFRRYRPADGNHFALANNQLAYEPLSQEVWSTTGDQGPAFKPAWSEAFFQLSRFNNGAIHSNSFQRVAQAPNGEIWVIGRDNPGNLGIYRDNGLLGFSMGQQGLQSTTNDLTFFGDHGYLATDEGFWKFDYRLLSEWEHFTNNGNIDKVNVIEADENGNIWLGTNTNGLIKFDGQTFTEYNTFNSGIPADRINAIAIQPGGIVWVGTHTGGMASFDGNSTWTVTNTSNGLPDNEVWGLFFHLPNSEIYVATNAGLAAYTTTTSSVFPNMTNTPTGNRFRSVAVDPDGNIYAGSLDGFGRLNGSDWEVFQEENSALTTRFINDVLIDPIGNKWMVGLSADRGGLFRYVDGNPGINPEDIQIVRGFVYFDRNSNGIYEPDLGDIPKPRTFIERSLTTGPNASEVEFYLTNENGEYIFYLTEAGLYSFEPFLAAGEVVTQSPATNLSYDPILPIDNPFTNTDIGIGPQVTGGAQPIIDLNVFKIRCNELVGMDISITNVGDEPIQSAALIHSFPSQLTFFTALETPDFNGLGFSRYDIDGLEPGASFKNRVFLGSFPETETGQEKIFALRAENFTLQNWEEVQTLNRRTVFCGVDPNDKLVSPTGTGPDNSTHPDSTLTYTIRFQNTGNDYAQNVSITDTLDPNLDLESFAFLNSSHPVQISWQPGNVLHFSFPGIMLPDSAT
ncbi:MAG: hypothetical protein AAFV80_15885, partial [Bacteroidota bacterium]